MTGCKPSDIGRKVRYRARHGDIEEGVITSFNLTHAFVRFGNDVTSKACRFADLEWVHPVPGE
jgi:hypothetical protein